MKKYIFLDDDLYKFSMLNVVLQLYPNLKVKYKFINRGKTKFPNGFSDKLKQRINQLSEESIMTPEEMDYMSNIRYFNSYFVWYLSKYRFDPNEIHITDNVDELEIEGYWRTTILWECRLLSMISELYYEMTDQKLPDRILLENINKYKGEQFKLNGINFAEFGTRRRFSFDNQDNVISDLINSCGEYLVGTSNVHFAKKYNIKPIGTMAHELFMAHAAIYGVSLANKKTLDNWIKIYNGDLGIALPDTFTTDYFLKDFDIFYAKLFDGLRQDSGDPLEIGNKILNHYNSLKLGDHIVKSRTIVFSDNLNSIDKILKIKKEFENKIRVSFGVGTYLTNDIPNIKPLNIVIKLSAVQVNGKWVDTIKLSDDKGKFTGNKETLELYLNNINNK